MTRLPCPPCPFCPPAAELVAESAAAIAVRDGFPVAEGHTLISPRQHVGSLFELAPEELADFFALVVQVRAQLADDFAPNGFTIGINDGEAAGQTVGHAHLHTFPAATATCRIPAAACAGCSPSTRTTGAPHDRPPRQLDARMGGGARRHAHDQADLQSLADRRDPRTARVGRRADPVSLRLAHALRRGWASEQERLKEAADWLRDHEDAPSDHAPELVRERLPQLESFGLAERMHTNRWRPADGDLATGRRIWEALRAGDTSMSLLSTTAQRRQGQRIFRARVLANFDSWCAVCPIGIPEILEAAHLLPVASYPEHGLDFRNGLCLCRNHHRAMDEGLLALDAWQPRLSASLAGDETAHGLHEPLSTVARRPAVPLLDHALDWRLCQLRG